MSWHLPVNKPAPTRESQVGGGVKIPTLDQRRLRDKKIDTDLF
jgi:hypothetical protein